MTKEDKKKKLEELDEQILNLMLKHTGEDGDTSLLTELSVGVNYLKSNSIVEEKAKSTIEEDVKKRREAAEKRRNSGESK